MKVSYFLKKIYRKLQKTANLHALMASEKTERAGHGHSCDHVTNYHFDNLKLRRKYLNINILHSLLSYFPTSAVTWSQL